MVRLWLRHGLTPGPERGTPTVLTDIIAVSEPGSANGTARARASGAHREKRQG